MPVLRKPSSVRISRVDTSVVILAWLQYKQVRRPWRCRSFSRNSLHVTFLLLLLHHICVTSSLHTQTLRIDARVTSLLETTFISTLRTA